MTIPLMMAAACGGEQEGDAGQGALGSPRAGSPTPTPAGDAASVAATVAQADFSFSANKVKAKSGATITVTNRSPRTPHAFTVPGKGIAWQTAGTRPGMSSSTSLPGAYEFVCTFHEARGMRGTPTVT